MADTQQKGKGGKPQNQKPQNTEKQQNNPKPDENKKPKNNQSNANPNPNKNETQASSQPASKKEEVKAPVAESTPQTNGAQQKPQTANQNQPKEKGAQPTQQKKDAPPKKQLVTGKGVVKSVPAGDTLIVIHMEKNAPPKEKKITLSNIHAPRLGHRSSSQKEEDEEFAWQSREFLRKAAVGKNVTYVIEGTSKSGKRDFGLVHIIGKDGSAQDLASLIVAEGWASVPRKEGESKGPLRADVEELLKLEEAAKKDKKGIFSNDKKHAKRPIIEISNVPEFYEKNKGHPVQGVVENVLNGSTVIVSLLPQLVEVRLLLSGVECPVQKNTGEWEPYGREAKFVTEHFLLHRDVQVIFEGADKYNLYGTLNLHGNNISEELLRRGLARLVEWSAQRTNFKDKLKAAEKFAQEKKACLYANFEQKPVSKSEEKKQLKPGKELFGKVIEIVSPGSVIVSDTHGNEHKISLSSIRAPRGGSLMPKPSSEEKKTDGSAPVEKSEKEKAKEAKDRSIALERTYAFEGKEFLRKKLIGQKVRCVLDYFRAPQNPTGQKEAEKPYWSVYYEKNNIAVELVAHGFASATAHRGGEQRSKDYEDILKAEALAKRAGKGVHTSEEKASVLYINDVTSDPQKARNFLSSLKRGKNRGVVEYIAHASRFKIYVPKENCELFLNLSAVKTPKTPGSEFFQESQYFVKNLIHQRDVEFEVVSVDKGGSFVGHVWINKENLAVLVLQEGFGTLLRAVARDTEYFNDLRSAEDVAKKTKKNLWHNYDEAAEQAAYEKRRQEAEPAKQAPKQELVDVIVTEIIDASKFYVQIVGKDAEKLDELMQTIAAKDKGTEAYSPKFGELVLAQFTADDAWYRAKTVSETTNGEVKVFYIDYGNTETVQTSRVRRISDDLTALPPQAVEAHLAYVKPPTLSEDYGTESAEFLKELVEGKTMMANVEYREGNQLFLSLGDRESQVHVNAALVRAGLARVEKVRGRHLQPLIAKLREEEEKARSAHTYIWEYGDAGSDDEDDDRRPQKRGSAPPAKKSASAPAKKEGKEEK